MPRRSGANRKTITMTDIHAPAATRNKVSAPVIPLPRPRLAPAPEGGWFVHRGSHAWLVGDRPQALREFKLLERLECSGAWRAV
jgi:hypothetical protein